MSVCCSGMLHLDFSLQSCMLSCKILGLGRQPTYGVLLAVRNRESRVSVNRLSGMADEGNGNTGADLDSLVDTRSLSSLMACSSAVNSTTRALAVAASIVAFALRTENLSFRHSILDAATNR